MYIKWIVCEVKEGMKKAFSKAQEQWAVTSHSKGFVGQIGGWELNNKNTACILSFWENQEYLEHFMANLHDKVFFNNNQADYYDSIHVEYYTTTSSVSMTEVSLLGQINTATFFQVNMLDTLPNRRRFMMTGKLNPQRSRKAGVVSNYLTITFFETLNMSFLTNLGAISVVDEWRVKRASLSD